MVISRYWLLGQGWYLDYLHLTGPMYYSLHKNDVIYYSKKLGFCTKMMLSLSPYVWYVLRMHARALLVIIFDLSSNLYVLL